MNVVGKFCLGLAAVWVLNLNVRADDVVPASQDDSAAGQPYATIVARNIFGLVPIPPPPPPPPPPVDPPPKITANGITTILGELQALFKVDVPAKAGQPAKQNSYMLTEGERQDEIEVTKIDEKSATITFNNHGVVQEIPLVAGQASGSSSSSPAAGPGGPPTNPFLGRFRRPGGFPGGAPGGFTGGSIPSPGASPASQPAGSPAFGGNVPAANSEVNPATQSTLTTEEQAIIIETERARLQSMATPSYDPNLLPPTKYTPSPNPSGDGQNTQENR